MLARVPDRMRRVLTSVDSPPVLAGRRVRLRPLTTSDFAQWREVRGNNGAWLTSWEPAKPTSQPDPDVTRAAFAARCGARDRDRQLGTGYGFGVFVDCTLVGEMNIAGVARGPFQSCNIGYWVDQRHAGNGYIPEAVVLGLRFAFEELTMHRVEIAIVPRNQRSRRGGEARPPLGGRGAAVPGDQRLLGGPRALCHHRRGVGAATRQPRVQVALSRS